MAVKAKSMKKRYRNNLYRRLCMPNKTIYVNCNSGNHAKPYLRKYVKMYDNRRDRFRINRGHNNHKYDYNNYYTEYSQPRNYHYNSRIINMYSPNYYLCMHCNRYDHISNM